MPDLAFSEVFSQLKQLISANLNALSPNRAAVAADTPSDYVVNTPYSEKYQRELLVCSVQIKKNYVSFYLFPVYMNPELLAGLSPELHKRMQGKSCFNFKKMDPILFKELEALTFKGIDWMKSEGLL